MVLDQSQVTWEPIIPEVDNRFEDSALKSEIMKAITNVFFDYYHNRPAQDYELDDMCTNVIEVIKKHFGKR